MIGLGEAAINGAPWLALMLLAALVAESLVHRVARRRRRIRAVMTADAAEDDDPLARAGESARRALERLNVGKLLRPDHHRRLLLLLVQGGYRSRSAPAVLLSCMAAGALAGCTLATGFSLLRGGGLAAPHLLAGVVAGAGLPLLVAINQRNKRQAAIKRAMPDAIDLLVICVEAGLGLDASLRRVGRELKPSAPEIADEFGFTALEAGFLPNRADAFANLFNRVPLQEVDSLATMLQQTERFGTPLGEALRRLADQIRWDAITRLEGQAMRLPALLTLPLMMFILPPLFIVLIGPALLEAIRLL